jgi:REP element-mobilizing transposase RayT
VLVGPVAERLEVLLREAAKRIDCEVLFLAIQPGHVHLFISAPPTLAPDQIMFRLKGYTAHQLREEFPALRKMQDAQLVDPQLLLWHSRHGDQRHYPAVHRAAEQSVTKGLRAARAARRQWRSASSHH